MKSRYPQLASGLAAHGEPVSAPSARADDHHDYARTAPTAEASDYRGTDSARPAAGPAAFDELFTRLRETWPS
jgi:hypothetical protein